jgi:hypothetical protein
MATLVETMPSASSGPQGPMAWLETGRGPIARGVVELLSTQGAHIRLMGESSIEPGDEVELRLSLDRDSPTVAATGQVVFTQEVDGAIECELEWTHTGPERELLEALIAARN